MSEEAEVASPKILLAEDDNDMRRFLARALTKAGYEVVSFDNGKAAYDRLREEPAINNHRPWEWILALPLRNRN